MTDPSALEQKLHALRDSFDRSFAEASTAERPLQLDFLAIRVAGDPYALRMSEVQSLHADRALVTAPSLVDGLLGVAGFRGVLTPIYDLSLLLGYARQPAPKWLVVARNAAPIGFAFETFEAHLRASPERVSSAELGAEGALRGAVESGSRALPLLHLPSLIDGIARRIKDFEQTQER